MAADPAGDPRRVPGKHPVKRDVDVVWRVQANIDDAGQKSRNKPWPAGEIYGQWRASASQRPLAREQAEFSHRGGGLYFGFNANLALPGIWRPRDFAAEFEPKPGIRFKPHIVNLDAVSALIDPGDDVMKRAPGRYQIANPGRNPGVGECGRRTQGSLAVRKRQAGRIRQDRGKQAADFI